MKNINIFKVISLLVILCLAYSCSDDDYSGNRYNQVKLKNDDGTVSYTMVESFPLLETIVSSVPQFEIVGLYRFALGEVVAPTGSSFNKNNFSINRETGVISYDNKSGNLTPGDYYVSVKLENTNGVATYNQAFHLRIAAIPLTLQADNPNVNVDFFDIGVVSTLSYTDTSGSGQINNVTYGLLNPPPGFSIDASTGKISKNTSAQSGVNKLTVRLTTNLGIASYTDFVIVTVGAPPTIAYKKQDGMTDLSKVILSPWTAYATSIPELMGMNAASYEMILPATLPVGLVTVASNGVITIAADQNLPAGTYPLGVKVKNNSGIEVTFENIFEVQVEFRWETTKLFNDNFNDDLNQIRVSPGNSVYPEYAGYTLGATDTKWLKIKLTHATRQEVQGLRVLDPGNQNHYLVRNVDITGVKALRISFAELFGYQDNFVDKYQRALYSGDSTADLDAGTFNPSNWNVVMTNSDPRWTRASRWNIDRGVTPVNNVVIDLSNISGNTLKLAWYLGLLTTQDIGQYFIDNISGQAAVAYPAEEQ